MQQNVFLMNFLAKLFLVVGGNLIFCSVPICSANDFLGQGLREQELPAPQAPPLPQQLAGDSQPKPEFSLPPPVHYNDIAPAQDAAQIPLFSGEGNVKQNEQPMPILNSKKAMNARPYMARAKESKNDFVVGVGGAYEFSRDGLCSVALCADFAQYLGDEGISIGQGASVKAKIGFSGGIRFSFGVSKDCFVNIGCGAQVHLYECDNKKCTIDDQKQLEKILNSETYSCGPYAEIGVACFCTNQVSVFMKGRWVFKNNIIDKDFCSAGRSKINTEFFQATIGVSYHFSRVG